MKIYLLDLAHTQTVTDQSLTVPLSIGYIKAYLVQEMGDSVDVKLFKHPEEALANIITDQPDIVGFANYGWNRDLNLKVGSYIREILPNALLVAGGPNIDPAENLRTKFLKEFSFLDYAIIMGGEEPFAELVSWWREGQKNKDDLPNNLIWLEGDKLHSTPERPLKKIIENIPSPYLAGYLDEFLARNMVPLLETNRGCPFSCAFCAWGMASQDLVRRFDHIRAIEEIEYIGARSQAKNWIVCDANFGILKRDIELAKAIRKVKDTTGFPAHCHVWTAKNVTERNLEIGEIFGDMAVPCMAVQSMDDEVLKNIKRSNISIDTYKEYQQKFHAMGQQTYSDTIIPLPAETMESHISGLTQLMNFGVDLIANHNMRLLAGAETNSDETREKFDFKTRYRLIHGDAGEYKTPTGKTIKSFEYEESLRATSTMPEEDVFYLRKLHFLVEFCWNVEAYKPLLTLLQANNINPMVALTKLIEVPSGLVSDEVSNKIKEFWAEFDDLSSAEWFNSTAEIEEYFSHEENFSKLVNLEYEKLNTLFVVKLLQGYKEEFDAVIRAISAQELPDNPELLNDIMGYVVSTFPSLNHPDDEMVIDLSGGFVSQELEIDDLAANSKAAQIRLYESDKRREVIEIILNSEGKTLSKILNTQGISMGQLKFSIDEGYGYGRRFKQYLLRT